MAVQREKFKLSRKSFGLCIFFQEYNDVSRYFLHSDTINHSLLWVDWKMGPRHCCSSSFMRLMDAKKKHLCQIVRFITIFVVLTSRKFAAQQRNGIMCGFAKSVC